MRRSILIRLVVSIMLAVAVQVVVAWTLALASGRRASVRWYELEAAAPMAVWMVDVHGMTRTPPLIRERRGLGVLIQELSTRDSRIQQLRNYRLRPDRGGQMITRRLPSGDIVQLSREEWLAELTGGPPRWPPTAFDLCWVEAGWPCRSLRGGHRWIAGRNPELARRPYWSYELIRDDTLSRDSILPLRPVAAPFAMNTLFYAVLVAFVLVALPAWRRRRRRRRGRCAECGHPVRGVAACPECGAVQCPA